MRTRRTLSFLAIAALSILVASCMRRSGTSHEVAPDLNNYSVELR